ncbi:MAG TPA: hypothetical protein VEX13_07565 [Chloroflexia bacterium]|nr:hypothetical protein [Chloroflexia bacterium]
MAELSEATWERLRTLFPPQHHEEAARLLAGECGNNLPFCEDLGPVGLERIRFAVLKLSGGNIEELRTAIKDAQTDWRDVLMWAGFADAITAHESWYP